MIIPKAWIAKKIPMCEKSSRWIWDGIFFFCLINLQPWLWNIKQHKDAYKHLQATNSITSSRKIFRWLPSKYSNKAQSMDIQYAVVMGQLSLMINKENRWFAHWNWFQVGEMKMHRTNCACVIKNYSSCFTWRTLW